MDFNTLTLSEFPTSMQEVMLDAIADMEGFKEGNKAFEYNNPGNLEYKSWQDKYGGQVGPDGRFARFSTPSGGREALRGLLFRPSIYSDKTLREAMNMYAPPNENNTNRYYNFILNRLTPQFAAESAGAAPYTSKFNFGHGTNDVPMPMGYRSGLYGGRGIAEDVNINNQSDAERAMGRINRMPTNSTPSTGQVAIGAGNPDPYGLKSKAGSMIMSKVVPNLLGKAAASAVGGPLAVPLTFLSSLFANDGTPEVKAPLSLPADPMNAPGFKEGENKVMHPHDGGFREGKESDTNPNVASASSLESKMFVNDPRQDMPVPPMYKNYPQGGYSYPVQGQQRNPNPDPELMEMLKASDAYQELMRYRDLIDFPSPTGDGRLMNYRDSIDFTAPTSGAMNTNEIKTLEAIEKIKRQNRESDAKINATYGNQGPLFEDNTPPRMFFKF